MSVVLSHSAGFGGSGGGGPGDLRATLDPSYPARRGVNCCWSFAAALGNGDGARLPFPLIMFGEWFRWSWSSKDGFSPFMVNLETRASSACVSWMYSAGGLGIRGGGVCAGGAGDPPTRPGALEKGGGETLALACRPFNGLRVLPFMRSG